MKFSQLAAAKGGGDKRAYVEPGVYYARIASAQEVCIPERADEADNPLGECLRVTLRFKSDDKATLPVTIPVHQQWRIAQVLAAVFAELPEGEVDVLDMAGATVVVSVDDWALPDGPRKGETLAIVKKWHPRGTTVVNGQAVPPPKGPRKKANPKPAPNVEPEVSDDDADDSIPF